MTKTSNHVGTIGQRIEINGVIRKIVGSGFKPLYVIHDIDGNEFTVEWTKNQRAASNVGSLVSFAANVLAHEIYNEVNRTRVSAGRAYRVDDTHPFRAKA